ncbi:MAG: hypothetical protein QM778_10545 [Myxococcales bacterium]
MSSKTLAIGLAIAAAAASGCGDQADHGALRDAGEEICLHELDLLFVIDNSVSKTLVHDRLSAAIPRFLEGLGNGDYDHDGTVESQAFSDIHVAVTTSDMGAYADGVPQCSAQGNDGLMLTKSLSGECKGNAYPYQIYVPNDESKPDELIEHVQCLASVGLQRCPYEQPLAAMYKALAPSSVTAFHGGSGGHGDRENAGFLRETAVLAVVHVTDEDDCSVAQDGAVLYSVDPTDPRLKSPDSEHAVGVNLRCALLAKDATLLEPVDHFVAGLKALKPGHPEHIVFGVLSGVPLSADGDTPSQLLALPESIPVADASNQGEGAGDPLAEDQTTLKTVCSDSQGEVKGMPAPRLIAAAQGFGDNGVARSVCADNFDPALAAVASRISASLQACQVPPDAGQP